MPIANSTHAYNYILGLHFAEAALPLQSARGINPNALTINCFYGVMSSYDYGNVFGKCIFGTES